MTKEYGLVVIGGGAAGLTAAEAAVVMGIDVALVDGDKLGGDCTWYGCIPSKALLSAAKAAYTAKYSAHMGIKSESVTIDFAQVMQFVHGTIEKVYHDETPDVLREQNIAVYEAYAKFHDSHTLELSNGEMIRARKIIIATGARNIIPQGFRDVPYLTNRTLFDLSEQPEHLVIVGGGPIGTEMAQAFCRLGSRVTLITDVERLLIRDEPQASELLQDVLRSEGVEIVLGRKAIQASGTTGDIQIALEDDTVVRGSHVLVAVGKYVDVSNLNPDAAGIETENGKLCLDDKLRTSQAHIYAAGDVAGGPMFTHAATSEATIALTNVISPITSKRKTTIPWATFTDPEVARAGITEAEAQEQALDYFVTELPITRADRALTEGYQRGFMKLVHTRYGKLLGATIVGPNAGEMMNEWAQIIARGGRVFQAAQAMHIYPTLGISNAILATEQMRAMAEEPRFGRFARQLLRRIV